MTLRSDFVKIKQSKTLKFQIINTRYGDSTTNEDSDSHYSIQLFGVTENGNTVRVDIEDFNPYFYIEMPDEFDKSMIRIVCSKIKELMLKLHADNIIFDECILEESEKLYGFTNHKKYNFLKISCKTVAAMRHVANLLIYNYKCNNILSFMGIHKYKFNLYESNIEPALRFFHIQQIKPADWVVIENPYYEKVDEETTCCHLFATASYKHIKPYQSASVAPFVCCAFDIECTSSTGAFPSFKNPLDEVIMVCSTFRRYGESSSFVKIMHTIKPCLPIKDCIIVECATERDLLLKWRDMIREMDPDIIYGYNSNGFDFEYMYERAKHKKNNIGLHFLQMSRIGRYEASQWVEKELSSSALGSNKLKYIDMQGRIVLDVMKEIQKEFKLDQYKLDVVAEHFTGENKVDLPPAKLFKKFKKGRPKDIKEIGVYCIQDTELCHVLAFKLAIVVKAMKMANVCIVPLEFIFTRGQGVKIFSLMANECRNANIKMPVIRRPDVSKDTKKIEGLVQKKRQTLDDPENYNEDDLKETVIEELQEEQRAQARYEGAMVIETNGGLYHDPITVLDFNSLYPSCQMAWNISHNTLVLEEEYDNIPGIKYETIEYTDYDGTQRVCRFAQTNPPGIIPQVIKNLLSTRKSIKNMMKSETDKTKNMILDCEQLAYKVVANSVYGQCGANVSPIYLKEIAACTTAKGREMLNIARIVGNTGIDTKQSVNMNKIDGKFPLLHKRSVAESTSEGSYTFSTIKQIKIGERFLTNSGWATLKEIKQSKSNKSSQSAMEYLLLNQSTIKQYMYEYYPKNNNTNIFEASDRVKEQAIEYNKSYHLNKLMFLHTTLGHSAVIRNNELILNKSGANKNNNLVSEDNTNIYYNVKIDVYSHTNNVECIYGDTDSNFYKVNIPPIKGLKSLTPLELKEYIRHTKVATAMDIGKQLSIKINDVINKPGIINFAYEKVLFPFLIITKKRYYGRMYEDDPDKYKDKVMGLALKRRNYCTFTKNLMQILFDKIMESTEPNTDEILTFLNTQLMKLIDNKVSYKDLLITSTLGANYKNPNSMPHRRVADAMIKNQENVNTNDRIPYIFAMAKPEYNTLGRQKKPKIADIAMHPQHAKDKRCDLYNFEMPKKDIEQMPYDPQLYIEGQIEKPISQVLAFIVKDSEEFFRKYIDICIQRKIELYGDPVIPLRKKPTKKIKDAFIDGLID